MNPVLLGHLVVFGASALACLASVPRARTIHHEGTRRGMVALLVSVALWSAGYVGYLLAPTMAISLAFYVVGFAFAFLAVGAFIYFCAAYTGRSPENMPFRTAVVTVFLVLIGLKLTNAYHNLFFTAEWTTTPFAHPAITHQLLYWIVLGMSYMVTAVGFFMLLERFHYTGSDSRPLTILVALTGVPAAATVLGSSTEFLLPLMYEPPGVALFAVGTLFIYTQRFESIRITGDETEPTVFLDADGRVRDYNRAAHEIVPALEDSVGAPLESVDASLAAARSDAGVFNTTQNGEMRYYQVSNTGFASSGALTAQVMTLTDVTDRETYRQQLESKTEQLEALNRLVRHDIRNDMAVIHGWASVLEDHVDEEGEDALERVLHKSQHVIDFTETLRVFVDSLTGDSSVDVEPVDLREYLETELTAVRESYPDARIQMEGGVPETAVRANELLASVFRNITENAVEHSDEATPTVHVTCTEQGDTVHIRFADNGPGIPDDRKESIFGKGEKGLESGGSGIGLYLVATLTEQFGGQVWVEDNEPKGAVFVVELRTADGAE